MSILHLAKPAAIVSRFELLSLNSLFLISGESNSKSYFFVSFHVVGNHESEFHRLVVIESRIDLAFVCPFKVWFC